MTILDDYDTAVRQRAELRRDNWMIPLRATPEHKARVLALCEQQAAQLPPFTDEQLTLAKQAREILWSGDWLHRPEDMRITQLEFMCRAIMGGDKCAGDALATEALWS